MKCKSDLVITNLNVLRKFRHGKKYDIFEKEILTDCKLKKQEINENSRVESQEDGKINQM